MKDVLVLITKNFPFGHGETFIENELEIAAVRFKKIIILVYQADVQQSIRYVPENVQVIPLERKNRLQKLLFYIRILMDSNKLVEVLEETKKYNKIFEKRKCCSFCLESILKEYQAKPLLMDIFTEETEFILYSYWLTDTAYLGYRLLKCFGLLGKKIFVSRGHGYDLYKERNQGMEFPFRTQIFDALTKIYPCSKQGEHYLKKEYVFWTDKYSTNYLGTMGGDGIDYKKNNNENNFLLVTCSNIIPLKRLNRLAEALCEIENQWPDIAKTMQWICIGDGESEKELRAFCDKNLRNLKVQFKGRKRNKEIVDFYHSKSVDLFINVSETEGLPVSIMEAMANRIPVIATDVGGTSEIVENHVNGILLKKDFENGQLVSAIMKFVNMPLAERKIFSEKAYWTWKSKFDCNVNYNKFYDEITNLS